MNRLEEARCCTRPSPWQSSTYLVVNADWGAALDQDYGWGNCPDGYFLNGLYRSSDDKGWLYHIEQGRCVKPADAPSEYMYCNYHDIDSCFDDKGWCTCDNGYFVNGSHRGPCYKLNCLIALRCCKPVDAKETLDELFKVRN